MLEVKHCINLKSHQLPVLSISLGLHRFNTQHLWDNDLQVKLCSLLRSRWISVQQIAIENEINHPLEIAMESRQTLREGLASLEDILPSQLDVLRKSIVPLEKLDEATLLKVRNSNLVNCPYFHYRHSLLEVSYFLLKIYYDSQAPFEQFYENVLKNLFLILHEDNDCDCTVQFMRAIQGIANKVDHDMFWRTFNRVLERTDPAMCLLLLKQTATTELKPNYVFLEQKFQQLLNGDIGSLLSSLQCIQPLISELWIKEPRIEIYFMIWEFYSKKLNVSTRNPSTLTVNDLMDSMDSVVHCPKSCTYDFDLFVGLLTSYLKEYPSQWSKMKGRIFTMLGPAKIRDLADIGVMHVIILFTGLSALYFDEIEKRLISVLDSLSESRKMSDFVWDAEAALIIRHVREGHSVERLAIPLRSNLQKASLAGTPKHFSLINKFFINLTTIIDKSLSMRLHQWQLFGPWLNTYLTSCTVADLPYALSAILKLVDKCYEDSSSLPLWESCFKDIFGYFKPLVTLDPILGHISAKLALSYPNFTNEAITFFTSPTVPPKAAVEFLHIVLKSFPDRLILTSDQEILVIQCWVNISFLSCSTHQLNAYILILDSFPQDLKYISSSVTISNLIEFFDQSSGEKVAMFESFFAHLDQCLENYLKTPESADIVMSIYRYSSQLINNNLVYNRHKNECILIKLVPVLLLPSNFVIGRKPLHTLMMNAMKTYWFHFYKALVKYKSDNDRYIANLLKDLITKYLPLFDNHDSPILKGLRDPMTSELILDKIHEAYLTGNSRGCNADLNKALKVLEDITKNISSALLYKMLVNKTLNGLFQLVVLDHQRNGALVVIKQIIDSSFFEENVEEFKMAVIFVTTTQNIGFHNDKYFQLMIYLAKFVPDVIRGVLNKIQETVVKVERLRGVGFEGTIRNNFEMLKRALQ